MITAAATAQAEQAAMRITTRLSEKKLPLLSEVSVGVSGVFAGCETDELSLPLSAGAELSVTAELAGLSGTLSLSELVELTELSVLSVG